MGRQQLHHAQRRGRRACLVLLVAVLSAHGLSAQGLPEVPLNAGIVEPPVVPDLIRRDAEGRATIRAVRATEPLRFDGALTEPVYASLRPITDFIQNIPDHRQPASQRTEAWVLFDDTHIYVAARCWDTRPRDQWNANEMRRDALAQQDSFGFVLDTYYDRRSGFIFYANALGARHDVYISNEGGGNADFNPVWDVRTQRFDGGWTIEMQVPFKSLRYRPGAAQVWGMQLRRTILARNEWAFASALPLSIGGVGLVRISTTPTLVGIEVPPSSKNLELKPYAIARLTTDNVALPRLSNDVAGDAGLDVKYGITPNLTLDVTLNTDMAQVEVDEQQVNLTRFNLLFPEKRDFFLEGRGNFDFGGENGAPQVFFSRQIGLNRGRVVPILAGSRVTGKIAGLSVGALNVQTGDEPVSGVEPTNFTVLRVKQDLLRRSSFGGIVTSRSRSTVAPGEASRTYGADLALAFFDNLSLDAYYAKVDTPGLEGRTDSYQGQFAFTPDAYGVTANHVFVGDEFRPEVGFVRRGDMRRTYVSGRLSPRPKTVPRVERVSWTGDLEYIENGRGVLETRVEGTDVRVEFDNADNISASVSRTYDRLPDDFAIAPGIVIPAAGYTFTSVRGAFTRAAHHRAAGTLSMETGRFYDGSQTTVGYSNGRLSLTPQLSIEPSFSVNRVTLPGGAFTTQLYRTRMIYTVTPRMYLAGLMQYNTSTRTVGANLRLRWEYTPGSELFVVYTDDRNTAETLSRPGLLNRALAVKITRLLRF